MIVQQHKRAVAPVVGIALLIGITVILAAVIGSVLFDISGDPSDEPEVTLSFTVDGDTVVLKHEGGETLDDDEIVVRYGGTELDVTFDGSTLSAGDREVLVDTTAGDPPFENADRISVIWQDPTSDTETVLATFKP